GGVREPEPAAVPEGGRRQGPGDREEYGQEERVHGLPAEEERRGVREIRVEDRHARRSSRRRRRRRGGRRPHVEVPTGRISNLATPAWRTPERSADARSIV